MVAFEIIHSDYGQDFYFVFNGGSIDGVSAGMTACVYDRDDEELFCGKVSKVNETRSGVFAGAEQEAWLETGFFVKIKELGDIEKNKKQNISSSLLAKSDVDSTISRKSKWKSGALYTPVMPFQYSHPKFDIDSRISGEGSVWTGVERSKQSLIGFEISYERPLTQTLDQSFTLLWRYLQPLETDSDYDPNSGSVYIVEKSSALDWGVEWNILTPIFKGAYDAYLLSGLGLEMISYQFSSEWKNDEVGQSEDVAASNASLRGLSGNFGVVLNKAVSGGFGAGFIEAKAVASVPLYAKTTWSHSAHDLPDDTVQKNDSSDQLEDAVQLKKNTMGVEIELGLGILF